MVGRPAKVAFSLFLIAATAAGSAHSGPLPAAIDAALTRADSLASVGRAAAGTRILDSLDAVATSGEVPRLKDAVLISRARAAIGGRRLDDGEKLLGPLLPRLRASGDTLLWVRAMRVQGRLLALRGRAKESGSAYRAAIRTAQKAGLRLEQSQGESAAAGTAFEAAHYDEAAEGYRRALAALGDAGNPWVRMRARAGLARTLQTMNLVEEARREHLKVLAIANQIGARVQVAETTYNLGVLEHTSGDMGKAEAHYREALAIYRDVGWTERQVNVANVLAILRMNAQRNTEADSILSAALPLALRPEVGPELRARVLCQVGILRREQGRYDEAVRFGRRAVDMSDSISLRGALDVTMPLCATLESSGRLTEDVELVDAQLRRLDSRLTPGTRSELLLQRAELALKLGRPAEAIGPLRAAVPNRVPRGDYGYEIIEHMSDLGRAYQALGQRDSSLYWHRRAAVAWEGWRAATNDPAWRERFDSAALQFSGRHAAAVLDGAGAPATRVAAAFDVLQPHRARTLAERIHDPASGGTPGPGVVSVARLKNALVPGELFLDVHTSVETTIVIAVARDTLAAWGAPRRSNLLGRLGRLRDLLAEPGSSAAIRDQAAAAIGSDLFGPGAALIAGAKTVVVAAGAVAQFPLGMLAVPGSKPLAGRLSYVPSATLLAAARSRPARGTGGLVAIARTRDESGRELPGAREEVEWLGRHIQGAEARVDDDRVTPAAVGTLTARAQVLHFAAHARDDPTRPWRSGLLLGRPGAADAWLEAWDVARFHPAARLCVLTGCESVGGGGDYGETLEGLATAWLAAGVPTAVASQWDVDDRSATAFVREFYEALTRGETVGAALRTAQDRLRANSATADPTHWAGFVTIGDPETRVTLRSR